MGFPTFQNQTGIQQRVRADWMMAIKSVQRVHPNTHCSSIDKSKGFSGSIQTLPIAYPLEQKRVIRLGVDFQEEE